MAKLPPLKIVSVVHIGSGNQRDMAISDNGLSLYFPNHLRKDGRNNLNHSSDGFMVTLSYPRLGQYGLCDTEREAKAKPLREHIASLQAAIKMTESSLLALYTSPLEGKEESSS